MDFFDELEICGPELRAERMRTAILCVSRAPGRIGYVEGTHAVVAAALLGGLVPGPEDEPWSATLPGGLLQELAADAVVAIERAHSPGSELHANRSELGDYNGVWKDLAPALRTLRAVNEPNQCPLF